ncbi:MAG: hypothetical protein JWM26_2337 [Betaproteobacteria bacterium]|nr:hypothetical protein [Betaproteobacteria bacterium]
MKKIAAVATAAVLGWGMATLGYAKLPAPSEEQKAKAAEAKAKADDSAKKDSELLGKYQDRAAEHYKRAKVVKTGSGVAGAKP